MLIDKVFETARPYSSFKNILSKKLSVRNKRGGKFEDIMAGFRLRYVQKGMQ